MKVLIISLVGALLIMFSPKVNAQNIETKDSLTFKVTGFKDNSGQLLVHLFRKQDKLPSMPFKVLEIQIKNKQAVVVIRDLPYGEYAGIFVHDKNANNEIDHRWGIPDEPLGFTNHWKLSLFSGMPTFNKLKFSFSPSSNYYEIHMKE